MMFRVVYLLAVVVLHCLLPGGQAGDPGVTVGDITVSPVTVAENTGPLVVTVSRPGTSGASPFMYSTIDETAVAPGHYEPQTDIFTGFKDGSATTTVNITINNNELLDGDRTFVLMLSNFANPQPAFNVTITIVDDEVAAIALTFQSVITKSELEGTFTLTISRSTDTTRAFTAIIATIDDTATAGADYQAVSTSLSFPDGVNENTVDFVVLDDAIMESSEFFVISVTGVDIPSSNITFTILDDDSPDDFNCEREPSQVCWNGGTCKVDGECDCAPEYTGADCLTIDAQVNGTGCDDRCGDNADCISTPSGSGFNISCHCRPGYAGEHCGHKAYAHGCTSSNFTVCISPHSLSNFQGMVYVRGMQDNCQLTLAPAMADETDGLLDWCQGYAATFEYTGSACGDFGPIPGDNVTYTLELIVQYNNVSLSPVDELVTFHCSYSNSTQTVYADTEISINPSDMVLNKQGGSGEFKPISMTLSTVTDQPLQALVGLGEKIKVCVVVDTDTGMQAVLITKVTVNNTRLDVPSHKVLYDQGCTKERTLMSAESPYWIGGNKNTMCVDITAFIFASDSLLDNPRLGVTVDALVFESPFEAAELPCLGIARRKRAAGSEAASATGTIVLTNPVTSNNNPGQTQAPVNQGPEENIQPVSTDTTCEDKEWLMPVIIALGVILAFLLGTIIVLGYAMFRRRSEPRKYMDEPEPRHRHYR